VKHFINIYRYKKNLAFFDHSLTKRKATMGFRPIGTISISWGGGGTDEEALLENFTQ
jgi:hypothetical protein